jgi:hypothetical protein
MSQENPIVSKSSNQQPPMGPRDFNMNFNVPILGEDNYTGWRYAIEMVLKAKDLWCFVTVKEYENDPKAQVAAAIITSSLSYQNLLKVVNYRLPYDIWTALESIFQNRSYSEKQMLLAKFHGYKITSIRQLSQDLGEIQSMAARLKMLGAAMDDDTIMSIILNGLPESFAMFKISWNLSSSSEKNLNKLISHVLAEAATMRNPQEARALVARTEGRSKRGSNKRWGQKNVDHSDSDEDDEEENEQESDEEDEEVVENEKKQVKKNQYKNRKNDICNYCGMKGHWAKDCPDLKRENRKYANVAFMAINDGDGSEEMSRLEIGEQL